MDRQTLRETLLDIVEQETWSRPEDLSDAMQLREGLNLDSVDMFSVMMRIESKLDIKLASTDYVGIESVGDLLDLLEAKLAASTKSKAA